jgi:hypothetical protein
MSQFGSIIAGTGSYVPEKRLTNDDLSKMVDTNDQWIVQRTGIHERRIAGPGDSTASMAVIAARKALSAAGIEASELDLIVCGTVCSRGAGAQIDAGVRHFRGLQRVYLHAGDRGQFRQDRSLSKRAGHWR